MKLRHDIPTPIYVGASRLFQGDHPSLASCLVLQSQHTINHTATVINKQFCCSKINAAYKEHRLAFVLNDFCVQQRINPILSTAPNSKEHKGIRVTELNVDVY